jgi:pimeloyl-ACP methyl ester carboxylesterase
MTRIRYRLATRSLLVGAVALALLTTGMTAAAPATTPTSIPAPAGLPAFYSVPLPLPISPGKLMKSQPITVPGLHGTMYRVMYASKDVYNTKIVAVTGVIAVPNGATPFGGFPVVSWGHGTNGMADVCAPSLNPGSDIPLANSLLDQGWVVTASDYQGEGTPGLMPYLAGRSAAYNTIDIVRAAHQLAAAHTGLRYVVWGHSEGGQTAMFSLKFAASYAPGYVLKGVVAGAPPSQFQFLYAALKNSPFRYYLLMAAGGLHAAYGDINAPLPQVLTTLGLQQIPKLDKGCTGYLVQQFGSLSTASLVKQDPFTVPIWKQRLIGNDPGQFTTASAAPLLIIQGGNDEQIPVASTQLLETQLCAVGQVTQRWIYPGQSHAGVIAPSANDMIHWINDRFTGVANPDPYVPTGQTDVQVTGCT